MFDGAAVCLNHESEHIIVRLTPYVTEHELQLNYMFDSGSLRFSH